MLSNKNVIIVLERLEMGGAERQALLLARYFKEKEGACVQIWGFSRIGRLAELCAEIGLHCRIVPFDLKGDFVWDIFQVAKFVKELRAARPDVILPYTLVPNVLCGLIWRLSGASLCVWNQRDEGLGLSRDLYYHRWAVRNTPLFISNSARGKEILVNDFSVAQSNVGLIRNGIELREKVHDGVWWRDRLGVGHHNILVGMIANLHKYKDHITLIKAWRGVVDSLSADGIQPRLVLAGRYAGTEQQVISTVSELGVQDSVTMLGTVDDISGLLEAIDIGVFSSVSEGSPNGLLECMAAGLPVVATDIPGIRDAVGPAGEEWLVSPGDIEALALNITKLARNNADIRRKIGTSNRERVENIFSPRQMCERTVSILRNHFSCAKLN